MDFKAIKYDNKYGEAVVIRPYVPQKDAAAALRLFNEAGWIERGKEPKTLDDFFAAGLALVGEVDGSVECITSSADGDMRYLDEELPLEGVTCVITGLPARRKGLARRMTAELMMHNAAKGAAVSVLGVFDLGFYDRLGYGTAIYEHHAACDLSDLRPGPARTPTRLDGEKDRGEIYQALLARRRGHGGCNLYSEHCIYDEIAVKPNTLGLGYRDRATGRLTHFLIGEMSGEHGPLFVEWLVWNTNEQLLELFGLLASFGDQIWSAVIPQPRGVQFQDLITRPLKRRPTATSFSEGGVRRSGILAFTSWQFRIMDLERCVSAVKIKGGEVKFNLRLTDPLGDYAGAAAGWRSLGGDWTITFGRRSAAARGFSADLPTLTASVGAFSRLWGGGISARGLAITDDFSAADELLDALDDAIDLPELHREWGF